MADTMAEAAGDAGIDPAALLGIGVGSPGEVDERTGTVSQARNLPGWEGSFALGAWLTEALGPPVAVGNDVQVATMAESKLGAGRPYRSLLGVFWGTGVGGGIVIDDRPWLGRGSAGEIGHMVIKEGGAHCTCGRRGCMEAYAGRAAMEAKARREHEAGAKTDLFKIMRERGRDRLTSGIWERALDADDPLATKLIDRAVEALGAGIASAANLLDPEAVVIGGGIGVRLGEPYVKRIRKQMLKHLFTSDDPAPVHVAALGDLGGAIGAALLSAADGSRPTRPARRASRAASAR
jgi:glucokinase